MEKSLEKSKAHLNEMINKTFNGLAMRAVRRMMPSIQKPSIKFDYEITEGRAILDFEMSSIVKLFDTDRMIKQMQEQFDKEFGKGTVSVTLYTETTQ
jgi:hypothetical protein